jgi:FkbM family methyltransferase
VSILGEAVTLNRNGVGAPTVLRMLTIRRGPTVVLGRRVAGAAEARSIMWRARQTFGGEYDLPGFEIRRGDSVVDVGANIGLFALLAVRRGARVVTAYEPHPETARWLAQNTAHLPVTVRQAAVMASGTTASLWLSPDSDTRHSTAIPQPYAGDDPAAAVVPAVQLADAVGDGCDVLKLDCEGEEFSLIRSTPPEVLRSVSTIVGELHEYAGDVREVQLALEAAGFEFRPHPGMAPGFSMFVARRR